MTILERDSPLNANAFYSPRNPSSAETTPGDLGRPSTCLPSSAQVPVEFFSSLVTRTWSRPVFISRERVLRLAQINPKACPSRASAVRTVVPPSAAGCGSDPRCRPFEDPEGHRSSMVHELRTVLPRGDVGCLSREHFRPWRRSRLLTVSRESVVRSLGIWSCILGCRRVGSWFRKVVDCSLARRCR